MNSLIQQLTDNPILLAVALVLVAIGGYMLVQRLLKPALFLLILLAAYIGYLVMTGQELNEELQKGKKFIDTNEILKAIEVKANGLAGDIINKDFTIACNKNAIKILDLQKEGKNKISAKEFLKGNKLEDAGLECQFTGPTLKFLKVTSLSAQVRTLMSTY